MMKKRMMFMLCTMMLAGSMWFTGCGNNGMGGSEAPYQDETQKKVNENNMYDNNMYNNNDMNDTPGNDLKDAGRNLMDSIKDTGDAIRDGVDNLGNGTNRNNP